MPKILISKDAQIEAHIIEGIRVGLKKPSEIAEKFGYSDEDEIWRVFLGMVAAGKLTLEVV